MGCCACLPRQGDSRLLAGMELLQPPRGGRARGRGLLSPTTGERKAGQGWGLWGPLLILLGNPATLGLPNMWVSVHNKAQEAWVFTWVIFTLADIKPRAGEFRKGPGVFLSLWLHTQGSSWAWPTTLQSGTGVYTSLNHFVIILGNFLGGGNLIWGATLPAAALDGSTTVCLAATTCRSGSREQGECTHLGPRKNCLQIPPLTHRCGSQAHPGPCILGPPVLWLVPFGGRIKKGQWDWNPSHQAPKSSQILFLFEFSSYLNSLHSNGEHCHEAESDAKGHWKQTQTSQPGKRPFPYQKQTWLYKRQCWQSLIFCLPASAGVSNLKICLLDTCFPEQGEKSLSAIPAYPLGGGKGRLQICVLSF